MPTDLDDGTQVVVFTSKATLKLPSTVQYTLRLVIHPSGHIEVHQHLVPRGKASWVEQRDCDSIPRVGWYGTFRADFHHFDRIELDLRGHTHVRGAVFSCLRLKLADMVLI